MKINLFTFIILGFSIASCQNESAKETNQEEQKKEVAQQLFQNKGHELVYNMVQKVGDYSQLNEKHDVIYTYTYSTPDGKTDISTEKYIFDGELSYGYYKKHERTLANLEGIMEQGYDGQELWLKSNDSIITNEDHLKMVAFNRPTNFYWFAMMPKLLDPGLEYEYIKEQTIKDVKYDVVKVSFNSISNKPKDVYQLYLNKETKLVDQFLFTVMEFDKTEPLLMQVEYEKIDGLLIPANRKYKPSNWDAEVLNTPWIKVNWTNIKFDNELTKADFKK